MNSKIKDFINRFSAVHQTAEQEMLPANLEKVVKEPVNPADVSDIFTTHYKPVTGIKTDKSIIQRDMVIHGSIETRSDIDVAGTVNGDISGEGCVSIYGYVSGNVSGKSVNISAKELNANITAKDKVTIDKDTTINGNITGGTITINGTVNGNLTATNDLMIMACSIITGDIEAPSMEVNRGAVINGKVTFTAKQ